MVSDKFPNHLKNVQVSKKIIYFWKKKHYYEKGFRWFKKVRGPKMIKSLIFYWIQKIFTILHRVKKVHRSKKIHGEIFLD
jgi:hypothetical protein